MLLKPGEDFNCDRIVELALRQDVKPDGSLSMNPENYQLRDWEAGDQPNWEYKKKYRDFTPLINSDAFFADSNPIQRRKRLFEFD